MNIRYTLLLYITVLALFISGFAIYEFYSARENKKTYELAQKTSKAISYFLEAAGHWAVERGVTNSGLNTATIPSNEILETILKKRIDGDIAYTNAIKQLEMFEFEGKEQILEDLETTFNKVENTRIEVDKNLKLNQFSRDYNLVKSWVPTMSELIILSQNLRFILTQITAEKNSELGRQAELKHFSWLMSEYAGRERAIIGGIIAANAGIDENQLITLSNYRGRVESGWETVQKLASSSNAEIRESIDKTNEIFFGSFQEVRASIYEAATNGDDFPLDIKEWIHQSTIAINTVLDTQATAIRGTNLHIEELINEANDNLIISLALLIFVILTAGSCYLYVNNCVIKRLQEFEEDIDTIANEHTQFKIRNLNKKNEIGHLAQSLEMLRKEADSSLRLRKAVKSVSTPVMFLDNDDRISYLNPAAIEMFSVAKNDIKINYPTYSEDSLVGTIIHLICTFPEQITTEIKQHIHIHNRTYDIYAAPAENKFGAHLGTVIEWNDITDHLQEQKEMDEFKQEIQEVVNATTKGDFTRRLNTKGKKSFLKNLAEGINKIGDVSQHGFSEIKQSIIALSEGDLSKRIEGEYQGEFLEIKTSLNDTMNQLSLILNDIKKNVHQISNGDFSDLIDTNNKKGFILELVTGINSISTVTEKGLSEIRQSIIALSEGDLSKRIEGEYQGEFLKIKTSFNNTLNQLSTILNDIKVNVRQISTGNFNNAIDTEDKRGFLLELAMGINSINTVVNKGLGEFQDSIEALSKGNLNNPIRGEYAGKFDEIKVAVNNTLRQLTNVMDEIKRSATAISQGNFMMRIDLEDKEGFLLELGQSINEISETSNKGLKEISDVLNGLSHGNLDKTIINDYQGSFLEIKEVVNGTIQKLQNVVGEIQDTANAVKNGDFTVRVDTDEKEGFLLDLSESLNEIGDTSHRGLNEIGEVLHDLCDGSLVHEMEGEYKGTFEDIKETLNSSIIHLRDMVVKIQESARFVNDASSEISEGSKDLSRRTEIQNSTLEETAAATEQLRTTVKTNTEVAQDANGKASEARNIATSGDQIISNTVAAMERIETSSSKVSDIIGVIDEIAFQTNLLALNAAVEAARAGEAGKGFAVVASEVRNLAGRSAAASKEIKDLINLSVEEVQKGSDYVKESGTTLHNIIESVNTIADLINQIASESENQYKGISEVNLAINNMDMTTQKNAALVEQSMGSSHSMSEQAESLFELTNFFTVQQKHG